MEKNKYQMNSIIQLAVGTGVTALIAGIFSLIFSKTVTAFQKNITVSGTEGANDSVTSLENNATATLWLGNDTEKSLLQFLPVYVIGGISVILILLFLRSRLGTSV